MVFYKAADVRFGLLIGNALIDTFNDGREESLGDELDLKRGRFVPDHLSLVHILVESDASCGVQVNELFLHIGILRTLST